MTEALSDRHGTERSTSMRGCGFLSVRPCPTHSSVLLQSLPLQSHGGTLVERSSLPCARHLQDSAEVLAGADVPGVTGPQDRSAALALCPRRCPPR